MNEKDPLEELFRKTAEENIPHEKPREIVWNKIENSLNPKQKKPFVEFIQSIWSAAAVFALIAIPYFYFFIDNLNKKEINTVTITQKDINNLEQTNDSKIINEEEDILNDYLSQIVKNENKIEGKSFKKNSKISTESITENVIDSLDNIVEIDKTTISESILLAQNKIEPINGTVSLNNIKEDTIFLAAASSAKLYKANVSDSIITSRATKQVYKDIPSVVFYRNRFVIQDQVNKISIKFLKKSNNKLIFDNGGIRISFTREKGNVSVQTNSKKIKPEILAEIISHKESIYNYYINLFPSIN